ncbi:uncharacterized protein PAC_02270 [Phialocephala subalpina]|uniref:C3H1-type domain-containing protein n=1 Tax=Phialocephala subalpina TaxID=576137 RepID=A0A1L7WHZ6_9HELO|nr:uncharacterized protein PAC_02270 [Phialocephala subalpina]
MNSSTQISNGSKQSGKPSRNSKKKPGICHQFRDHGLCKFGEDCKYRHVQKQQTAFSGVVTIHQPKQDAPAKTDVNNPQLSWAQAASKGARPTVAAKPAFKTKSSPKPKSAPTPAASANTPAKTDIALKPTAQLPLLVVKAKPAPPSSPSSTTFSLRSASNSTVSSTASSASSLASSATLAHDWDPTTSYRAWAVGKLRLTTQSKFLTPYIVTGQITPQLLAYGVGDSKKGDEFHYFSYLPGELRNKIWDLVLRDTTNNCIIKCSRNIGEDVVYQIGDGFEAVSPEPAILLVNQESRSFAIGHYELTFGTNYDSAKVLFNYERDRLFINTEGSHQIAPIFKLMLKRDFRRIVRLALPLRDAYTNAEQIGQSVSSCFRLKSFELVAGNSKEDEPYNQDKRILRKVEEALEFYWVFRWGKWGKSPPVPKVRVAVIDGVDAHFYGIDNLKWFAGQDTETFNWRRTGEHLNLAPRARVEWVARFRAADASRLARRQALMLGH